MPQVFHNRSAEKLFGMLLGKEVEWIESNSYESPDLNYLYFIIYQIKLFSFL